MFPYPALTHRYESGTGTKLRVRVRRVCPQVEAILGGPFIRCKSKKITVAPCQAHANHSTVNKLFTYLLAEGGKEKGGGEEGREGMEMGRKRRERSREGMWRGGEGRKENASDCQ